MNARTIRKRLMRSRVMSFWGRRAHFTVRVPMAAYPEPPPPKPSLPGLIDDGFGLVSDNGTRRIVIGLVHSWHAPDPAVDCACLIEKDEVGYSWWEVAEVADGGSKKTRIGRGEDLAVAARDRRAWEHKWVHGYEYPTGHLLPDALIAATWPAQTIYAEATGDAVALTYSVKWAYPGRK